MEDTKKTDNVVKIFIESLKESKNFSDQKIEQIAKEIVQVLTLLHDPSKKEFRDKVNLYKMKLKGSRNDSARQGLLSDKISATDFINMPQEMQNVEYFDSLIKDKDSTVNQNNVQNPLPRVNQMVVNQVRGTAPVPRGASRPGGIRAMPPQTNNFRPPYQQQIPKQQQEQPQNEQNNNLISNSPKNQEPVQYQIEVEQKIQEFTLDKLSDQKNNVSQENNNQNAPLPQFEETQAKTTSLSQEKILSIPQQQEKQKDDKLNQQQFAKNIEQSNQSTPPLPKIPPQTRNQPPITHMKNKQQIPQQRRIQQNEKQLNLQSFLPHQEQAVQDLNSLNQNQIVSQDELQQQQQKINSIQITNQNMTPPIHTEKQEIKQQQIQPPQSQIHQTVQDYQIKKKEEEEKNTLTQIIQQKNMAQSDKPLIQQINDQVGQYQQHSLSNLTQPIIANQQNLQNQFNNQIRQQQQEKNVDQKTVMQTKQQGLNQIQQQQQNNIRQQLQNNLVKLPVEKTEGDQEGECEDAHISQIKSHIDEFKKIKQQFREQHNAIDNEQILANVSNEYSYYDDDDDESYENDEGSNSQNNNKNILQNISQNKGNEDEVKNKSSSHSNQMQQLSTQQQPTSLQQPKHQQNTENNKLNQKTQKEKQRSQYYNSDYELHQQIENQKLQEELQRKQVMQQAAASHQIHNLAPESHFTTSQSSKQAQSKQRLDEMSDFEKIEINPVLRNQEFEDHNQDDHIHILHQQKVTNFGEHNIQLTNAFDIAVHQAHEKLSSDIALNQLDQQSNNGKSSQNPSHHYIESNKKEQVQYGRVDVNNQVEEEIEDNQSDNFQNILQGLNDQSRKGSGDEQTDKQDIQEDFIKEGREKLFENESNNVEIQIPANFSQSSPEQKSSQDKSRNTSQSSFTNKNLTDQQESVKKNQYSAEKLKNKQIFKDAVDENLKINHLNDQQNKDRDENDDGLSEFSSTQTLRLQQENKQLKTKLRQVLQEWQKNGEKSKKNLISKEKRNELLQKQMKETQDEISLIKQYLDQIKEENQKYKQQYEEMKLLFGQNENHLREELSQLKQKVKSEYTNEIQQLRSVNVTITQNNQYLQTALDSLTVDLEQKDLIIQKLSQHSSELINRSYQNINSKSLNYSCTNNQPPIASNQQQQKLQCNTNNQQQNILQVNNKIQQFENYDRLDTQEQEEIYGDGVGINAQEELQVEQLQTYDKKNNKSSKQQNKDKEQLNTYYVEQQENQNQDQNINQHIIKQAQNTTHIENVQNYDQKDNEKSQEADHIYLNQQHELLHKDSEKPLEYLINQQYTTQSSPEYQNKYKNDQEYANQSTNQNQEFQNDDAERFFDQLQDKDKQTPIIQQTPQVENQKNNTSNAVSKTTAHKNNIQNNKTQKQQEQFNPFGDDHPQSQIHNQSHSNFFELNSIPNMPTTRDMKNNQSTKRQNQRQKNTLDFNQAENTFLSTENDFFNTVVSDKFNTSNISAIHNPFNNNNNFFNNNFNNPFTEHQQSKNTNQGDASKKKVRNTGGGNLFN